MQELLQHRQARTLRLGRRTPSCTAASAIDLQPTHVLTTPVGRSAHESPVIGLGGAKSPVPKLLPPLASPVQGAQSHEVIMNFKYVVAIVPPETVDSLEERLRSIGVGGLTLTRVKGFGEYKNFFSNDWFSEHTKIEIFVEESKLEGLVNALLETARSDVPGAGVVAVMPVEKFLHLRTGTEVLPTHSA